MASNHNVCNQPKALKIFNDCGALAFSCSVFAFSPPKSQKKKEEKKKLGFCSIVCTAV